VSCRLPLIFRVLPIFSDDEMGGVLNISVVTIRYNTDEINLLFLWLSYDIHVLL
jgi:hypothetical protein